MFGQDLRDKEPAMETSGKEHSRQVASAKALRPELAEHVLRSTKRPLWPEGSEGREDKGDEVREDASWEVLSLGSFG